MDIAVAFQFLTRLPLPQVEWTPDGLARAVKFFPLVGLVVGSGAALLEKLLAPHLGRPVSAVAVLLYLVLITGCLHEDGLADVAAIVWPAGALNSGSQSFATAASAAMGPRPSRFLFLAGRYCSQGCRWNTLPLTWCRPTCSLCRWSMLPLSYYLPPARDNEGQGARIARG